METKQKPLEERIDDFLVTQGIDDSNIDEFLKSRRLNSRYFYYDYRSHGENRSHRFDAPNNPTILIGKSNRITIGEPTKCPKRLNRKAVSKRRSCRGSKRSNRAI
jgi:hypothetical protein